MDDRRVGLSSERSKNTNRVWSRVVSVVSFRPSDSPYGISVQLILTRGMTSSDESGVRYLRFGGSSDENGHISVMIPYPTYRRILAYLAAIQRPLEPQELISSILEGWARKLNL